VTNGVEEPTKRHPLIDGVVETVAPDPVVRFKHCGDDQAAGGKGEWRQELPEQLSIHSQRCAAAGDVQCVAVGKLGGHEMAGQPRYHRAPLTQPGVVTVGSVRQPHAQHAKPVGSIDHRNPQHRARVGIGAGEDLDELECAPGQAAFNGDRTSGIFRNRTECPLSKVH
jgi:hypothetical protein